MTKRINTSIKVKKTACVDLKNWALTLIMVYSQYKREKLAQNGCQFYILLYKISYNDLLLTKLNFHKLGYLLIRTFSITCLKVTFWSSCLNYSLLKWNQSLCSTHSLTVAVFLHKPQTEHHKLENTEPRLALNPCTKPLDLLKRKQTKQPCNLSLCYYQHTVVTRN